MYWNDDISRLEHSAYTKSTNTDGYIMKNGTSTTRVRATTAGNFFQNYLETTATSGTARGIYNRLYFTQAGTITGESLRSFTTVENVAIATAHGAHISLNFASTGSITGLGVGVRSTLHVPNQVQSGGTYAGGQSEIYFDGTSARIAGATRASIHRFVCDGVSGYTNDCPNVFEFVGLNATQLQVNTAAASEKILKITIDGVAYGIMIVSL